MGTPLLNVLGWMSWKGNNLLGWMSWKGMMGWKGNKAVGDFVGRYPQD